MRATQLSESDQKEVEKMRPKKICPNCFIQLKVIEADHRIMWECPECKRRWPGYMSRLPEIYTYDNDDDMFGR